MIILVVAAALFAAFLVRSHLRADHLLRNEDAALANLPEMARPEAKLPADRDGYRFLRTLELTVARPVRPGTDGVRWFASPDGKEIWEYDTVLYGSVKKKPDVRPLARYLGLADKKRKGTRPPYGWRLVPANTMGQ